MLRVFDRIVREWSRRRVVALALLSVALLGIVDIATGFELSFSIFYLGPVAVAAWYAGRRNGLLVAILAATTWLIADLVAGHIYSSLLFPLWNSLVRLGYFSITVYLLTRLRRQMELDRHLARIDSLSGTFNRRAFREQLEYTLALAARHGLPVSLAYIDLDDFKRINDTLGHAAGDAAIRRVGDALKASTRRTDTVARLGGDEFAVLLPNTDRSGAEQLLRKARDALYNAAPDAGHPIRCSIGAVTFRGSLPDCDAALGATDALMYQVKAAGKDAILCRDHGEASSAGAANSG